LDSKFFKPSSKQEDYSYQMLLEESEENEVFNFISSLAESIRSSPSNEPLELTTKDSMKDRIRYQLEEHLIELGYTLTDNDILQKKDLTKQDLRRIQSGKRKEILFKNLEFLRKKSRNLLTYVANGEDIDPHQIEPELVVVKGSSLESDLFRFLTLYWSVPVSQGYGRRIRFLIKDKQNNKVIGLFALADPVFNLKVRDNWIGWDMERRKEMLRSVMDAFVLGAVPPYSNLLGGKLTCILATSKEVRETYREKYRNAISVISKRRHNNELLMLTTTSALGKSSLYDRLKLDDRLYFIPVGTTQGYGHFHIPQYIFSDMRKLLERIEHPYAKKNRFGHGPNWKMRVIRRALQECSFSNQFLRHSIKRTSYLIPLAENTKECLNGVHTKPRFYEGDVHSLSRAVLKRWVIPRSERKPEFKDFRKLELLKSIVHATGRFDDTR